MDANYTGIINKDGARWIGWVEEVPGVNRQETTRDELVPSLRVALGEALDLNRREARAADGTVFSVIKIAV